ncbi:MAG: PCRF domain-containing protein, partial [Terrimicrobiaceae bacterium]
MPTLTLKLSEIEARMAAPDFWDHRERAQRDVAEVSALRGKIQPMQVLESRTADLDVLRELALEEAPENQAAATAEVLAEFSSIQKDLD